MINLFSFKFIKCCLRIYFDRITIYFLYSSCWNKTVNQLPGYRIYRSNFDPITISDIYYICI